VLVTIGVEVLLYLFGGVGFVSALLSMFTLLYGFNTYKELISIKDEPFNSPSERTKLKYAVIAIIGFLFIVSTAYAVYEINNRRQRERVERVLEAVEENQRMLRELMEE
jgi:uncharacterized membrane protein YidH (DUF202 family)